MSDDDSGKSNNSNNNFVINMNPNIDHNSTRKRCNLNDYAVPLTLNTGMLPNKSDVNKKWYDFINNYELLLQLLILSLLLGVIDVLLIITIQAHSYMK